MPGGWTWVGEMETAVATSPEPELLVSPARKSWWALQTALTAADKEEVLVKKRPLETTDPTAPSLFEENDRQAANLSVELSKKAKRELQDEEDLQKPSWMRYLPAMISTAAPPPLDGPVCPSEARPSCNPFAPPLRASKRRGGGSGSAQRLASSAPYSSQDNKGHKQRGSRKRFNVDETAMLFSFMK